MRVLVCVSSKKYTLTQLQGVIFMIVINYKQINKSDLRNYNIHKMYKVEGVS